MTKEQERAELHRVIWQIANDLRGSVDGWDFKSYVLGILFYRYISENITAYINKEEHKTGNTSFDYATLDDTTAENARDNMVQEKGFFILPSELFCNVKKNAKNDDNLNQTLSQVFKNIELSSQGSASEDDFKGLFSDIDVNSNKLGNSVPQRNAKLVKILDAIGDLKLGNFTDNTIDAFGDAYEYLMTMYASNAGKSGGEFFTPQEVSTLLTKLTLVDTSVEGNYKKEVNYAWLQGTVAVRLVLDNPFREDELKYLSGAYYLNVPREALGDTNFGKWLNNNSFTGACVTNDTAIFRFQVNNKIIDVLGIDEISATDGMEQKVYDLAGRRVNNAKKPGVYIVNGKKIMVK